MAASPTEAPERREAPGRYFDPAVLARIANLTLRARHVVEGIMAGLHRSALRGLSVEFSEHRAYVPGDELRRVDWKLFGRQDRYFVKEYEAETNLRAHIVVDASASMSYAGGDGMSKFEYAATIAASLAHLMLLQRDAVGIAVLGPSGLRSVPVRARPSHLRALTAALEGVTPGGRAELPAALAAVAKASSRRGLFVLITDFLDDADGLEAGIRQLRHRRNDVMAFHVAHPDELDLPFRGVTLFRDLESPLELTADPSDIRREYLAAFGEHRRRVRGLCRSNGADYELFRTDERLDRSLVRYLARREG